MHRTPGTELSHDPAQFVALLSTCQRPVFLYALSLLHNSADAEEVLQETNLVLWQKFDQYQLNTGFVPWACRIAYYEVLKLRQKRSRQERLFDDKFFAMLSEESQKSLESLDERREALTCCLQKLGDSDRQLVNRRYEHNATTRSVAEALGRSVQGTRKSLHRIRTKLLECVQRTLAADGAP